MDIELKYRNKIYLLESDIHQFILSNGYKETKSGKKRINPRYYPQIDQALLGLLNETIKNTDAKSIMQLYNEITKIRRMIIDKTNL